MVNTRYKGNNITGSERYSVLLPIDPFHVANFLFTLRHNASQISPSTSALNQWLPCSENAVGCINKIRVIVAPLYEIAVNNQSENTQIVIKEELSQGIDHNKSVQAIEYLISNSHRLTIVSNQIPAQTFAFFSQDHHFQFENNSLKSEAGFQTSLQGIKKLTLEFTNKVSMSGSFTAPAEQQLVINHLKGGNETSIARLNTTQCKLFIVSLGQQAQLIDQSKVLTVLGNFTTPILEASRHDKNKAVFYHLLKPINYFSVNATKGELLDLFVFDDEKGEFGKITLALSKIENEKVSAVFSGNYKMNGQTFFARIFANKATHLDWECNLEVNINTTNSSQDLDLSATEKQLFNKVSILAQGLESLNITHTFFYRSLPLPSLSGKFIDYRLEGCEEGWLLRLKHEQAHEATHVFLAENISELIINNVRYVVKPALASLFAVDTVNKSLIDAKALIASVKITSLFSETAISLEDKVLKIGNISLVNFSPKQTIYFEDQSFPLSYLQYSLKTNRAIARNTNVATVSYVRDQGFYAEVSVVTSAVSKPTGILQVAFKAMNQLVHALFSSGVGRNTHTKDEDQERADAYYDRFDRSKERSAKTNKNKSKKSLAVPPMHDGNDNAKQSVAVNKPNSTTLIRKLAIKSTHIQSRKADFFAKTVKPTSLSKQVPCSATHKQNVSWNKHGTAMSPRQVPVKASQSIGQTQLFKEITNRPEKYSHSQRIAQAKLSGNYQHHHSHQSQQQQSNSNDIQSTVFLLSFAAKCLTKQQNRPVDNQKIRRIQQQLERKDRPRIPGQPLGVGIHINH